MFPIFKFKFRFSLYKLETLLVNRNHVIQLNSCIKLEIFYYCKLLNYVKILSQKVTVNRIDPSINPKTPCLAFYVFLPEKF